MAETQTQWDEKKFSAEKCVVSIFKEIPEGES